jgi:5'-nucleotidase
MIEEVLKLSAGTNILLNINIPEIENIKEMKGVKITKLGVKKYRNNFEERKDPRGDSYYWLAGELIENEIGEDTDIYAVRNGYISMTPLKVDLTDYDDMARLKEWKLTQD